VDPFPQKSSFSLVTARRPVLKLEFLNSQDTAVDKWWQIANKWLRFSISQFHEARILYRENSESPNRQIPKDLTKALLPREAFGARRKIQPG
jgi:hypothetical protein